MDTNLQHGLIAKPKGNLDTHGMSPLQERMLLVTRVAYLNSNGFEYSKHGSWPRAKLRGNKETQKLAPLHKGVQLIRMEANLNSKIQILRRVATVGKWYFGLYKDLVLIVGNVREFRVGGGGGGGGGVPLYL